jgi:hypothetical protein
MFIVRMALDSDEKPARLPRGVAIIDGEPRSIAMRVPRRISRVLSQERGFRSREDVTPRYARIGYRRIRWRERVAPPIGTGDAEPV